MPTRSSQGAGGRRWNLSGCPGRSRRLERGYGFSLPACFSWGVAPSSCRRCPPDQTGGLRHTRALGGRTSRGAIVWILVAHSCSRRAGVGLGAAYQEGKAGREGVAGSLDFWKKSATLRLVFDTPAVQVAGTCLGSMVVSAMAWYRPANRSAGRHAPCPPLPRPTQPRMERRVVWMS